MQERRPIAESKSTPRENKKIFSASPSPPDIISLENDLLEILLQEEKEKNVSESPSPPSVIHSFHPFILFDNCGDHGKFNPRFFN
jgi:hypothetical protein